jgi:hypothetical protein
MIACSVAHEVLGALSEEKIHMSALTTQLAEFCSV